MGWMHYKRLDAYRYDIFYKIKCLIYDKMLNEILYLVDNLFSNGIKYLLNNGVLDKKPYPIGNDIHIK